MKKNSSRGFTMLELLVTLSIIVAVGAVAALNLGGRKGTANLTATTQQIGALLREAQSDSLSQSQGAQWGVHFDNTTSSSPFYSLFYTTSTYASGTIVGQYPLPAGMCYATSSVAVGTSTNILFSEISGAPTAAATITFQLMASGGCATATSSAVVGGVTRTTSGKTFFDDFNRSNL